jgi:Xaa-Pro aminopeptidase
MALEDGSRTDFTGLRAQRRAKVFDGMARHGLDALLLGGVGNVRYASGARQLGRAGVLAFAPAAVVVAQTGKVHLLSTWDEGVPPEIGREDLYGLVWNPVNLASELGEIPGLRAAARVGTDGLTPMFAALIADHVTTAEIVDAAPVMQAARQVKTPDEITCVNVAAALAESALTAMEDALLPGVAERDLLGVYHERVAVLGAPNPPSEAVCFATPTQGPVRFRHLATGRPIGDGELVVLAPGALYAGYEAGLACTRIAGRPEPPGAAGLADRCARSLEALLSVCGPGNTGADLYRAWRQAGNPEPEVALAHGLGLGAEPPVIGFGRGADAVILQDMVLCVQSWVTEVGTGGFLQRVTVHIDGDGPSVLTRFGR